MPNNIQHRRAATRKAQQVVGRLVADLRQDILDEIDQHVPSVDRFRIVVWDPEAKVDADVIGAYTKVAENTVTLLAKGSGITPSTGMAVTLEELLAGFTATVESHFVVVGLKTMICSDQDLTHLATLDKAAIVFGSHPLGIADIEDALIRGYVQDEYSGGFKQLHHALMVMHRQDGVTSLDDLSLSFTRMSDFLDESAVEGGHWCSRSARKAVP